MEIDGARWSLPTEMVPEDGVVQRVSWQVGRLGGSNYGDAKVGMVHEHCEVGPNEGVGVSWLLGGNGGKSFGEVFGDGLDG